MKRNERPAIGTKMYSVHEHPYYIPAETAPVIEYCVCEAEVQGFFEGGYVEICLRGEIPDKGMVPYRYRLKDVGEKVFYTPREAAELAQRMTEKYERTWIWMGDPPMRRPWAHLFSPHLPASQSGHTESLPN